MLISAIQHDAIGILNNWFRTLSRVSSHGSLMLAVGADSRSRATNSKALRAKIYVCFLIMPY